MSEREAAKKRAREIHLLEMYLRSLRGHDTAGGFGLFLIVHFIVCSAIALAITLGFHA